MTDPSQTAAIQITAFVKRRALRSTLIRVAMIGSGFGLFCFMMVVLASELAAEKAATRGHLQAGQVTMFDVVTVVESLGMTSIYVVIMLMAVPAIFVAYALTRQSYQQSLAACAEKAGISQS